MARCPELRLVRRPARPALPAARLALEALEARAAPAAGQLDPTFGNGGLVQGFDSTVNIALPDGAVIYRNFVSGMTDVRSVLLPNGRVVVASSAGDSLLLTRYRPDGAPDASFGVGGQVKVQLADSVGISSLLRLADGRLVVAGSYIKGTDREAPSIGFLARFSADGTTDSTFGDAGRVEVGLEGPAALSSDGKVIIAGQTQAGLVVARFNQDGSPDTSFGQEGRVTVAHDESPYDQAIGAVAVQPDGKVVLAWTEYSSPPEPPGWQWEPNTGTLSDGEFVLARLNPDGTLDTAFGDGGQVTTVFGQSSAGEAVNATARAIAFCRTAASWSAAIGSTGPGTTF